jgi:hypothetical protein
MPKYGDAWVDEMVDAVPFATIARREAARSQLKAMVRLLNVSVESAPPPTPPVTQQSIFAKPGWMAVRFDKLPTTLELARAGVFWVAAILSHGVDGNGLHSLDTDDKENQAWLAAGKAQPYRDKGIKVGGWGWQQGWRAAAEAEVAAEYVKVWTLDLWIANGEESWKDTNQPEVFTANFAAQLALAGKSGLPVAWSVLGAASGTNVFPFDYKAFTSRGWHVLPQAYPSQAPEYDLPSVIDHAVRAGIPLNMLHPTVARYDPPADAAVGAFKPTVEAWCERLKEAKARGVTGFSVWASDFSVDDVRRLVEAAR